MKTGLCWKTAAAARHGWEMCPQHNIIPTLTGGSVFSSLTLSLTLGGEFRAPL